MDSPDLAEAPIVAGKTGDQSITPFQAALETLVSAHATFDQKQAAWHQFDSTNLLDQVIGELENRSKMEPPAAEPHAMLGLAYLRKCAMIQDVREMGILAMKADQVFDTALELDPSNWDARFTKATAMSMWPPELKKGPEVIEHFRLLVEQQEAQSPQPHFAMTYVKLGEQYEKAGSYDDARQVFERGAQLFPMNNQLQARFKTGAKE